MNRTISFSILMLLSTHMQPTTSPVRLVSEVLVDFDGSSIGITGNVIARIKKYQSKILDIIMGAKDHASGKRHGKYEFQGQLYSVQELAKLEESLSVKSEQQIAQFTAALKKIRHDFEFISIEFRPVIHGAKAIMSNLIEESCKERNRMDSLLLAWAQTQEKNEMELFDQNLKSIKSFEIFMIDLYNFLEDLVHSCPKAHKQFNDQLEKYKSEHADKVKRVKELLSKCSVKPHNEAAFLVFIGQALDKIPAQEISQQKITALIHAFNKDH